MIRAKKLVLAMAASLVVASAMIAPSPARAGQPQDSGLADLVASLLPAVVNIAVQAIPPGGANSAGGTVAYKHFVGSGFVVDPSGLILTNRHVIENANDIVVGFTDGTRLTATLLYVSHDLDLAVLKVKPDHPLQVIKWGDSERMRPGDTVITIGNPLGLGSTVTVGVISALNRDIHSSRFDAFLQIDAALNHGNSGGPLFNREGEVVGVNTAIYSPTDTSGSIGLGFSIPGNDAQFVLNNLKEYGRVRLGYLGATFDDVTPDMAEAVGAPHPWGGIVTAVTPGTPAEKAGLKIGDIVFQIADHETPAVRNIRRLVSGLPIGEPMTLMVWRDGQVVTLQATTVESEESLKKDSAKMAAMPVAPPMTRDLGLTMALITPTLRQQYALAADREGMVITGVTPHGAADDLGLKPGMVLITAQGKPVASLDELRQIVDQARAEKRQHVLVLLSDGPDLRWLAVPIPPAA
jgi:serine protease Do